MTAYMTAWWQLGPPPRPPMVTACPAPPRALWSTPPRACSRKGWISCRHFVKEIDGPGQMRDLSFEIICPNIFYLFHCKIFIPARSRAPSPSSMTASTWPPGLASPSLTPPLPSWGSGHRGQWPNGLESARHPRWPRPVPRPPSSPCPRQTWRVRQGPINCMLKKGKYKNTRQNINDHNRK